MEGARITESKFFFFFFFFWWAWGWRGRGARVSDLFLLRIQIFYIFGGIGGGGGRFGVVVGRGGVEIGGGGLNRWTDEQAHTNMPAQLL